MITHDVDEAILLADRILLMSNGRIGHGLRPRRHRRDGDATRCRASAPAPACTTCRGYYDFRNHIVDFLVTRATAH